MAKKERMNRGLDDLFSDNSQTIETAQGNEKDSSTKYVRISLVEPNKNQPRENFDDEKLGELADSIKENGVLQPILVRPLENGGYQIVAGERRWRASRLAGLTEIPVLVKELTDKQTMQIAIIENIQRQDLSPIEESLAYQKLMDTYSMTQQEVSEAVGKSRSAVANSLRLLSLCGSVKQMLAEGKLTVGHAKILVPLSEEKQTEYAEKAVLENMSVRELEDKIAKSERAESGKEKKIKDNSFVKERPFLKEFEVAVNCTSNIKVSTKSEKDGGAKLTLKIDRECDIEKVLSGLADVLTKY